MSQLLESLLDPERQQQCDAADAAQTMQDERAVQALPDDVHDWAAAPSYEEVELFFNQTCREAP